MIWKTAIFLIVAALSSISHSQTFRIERPVPDSIETQGNYLYGEPWFWGSGGAHRGLDMWVVYDTVYSAMDGYVEFAAFAPGEDGYEPDGFGNYLRTRSTWNVKTLYIYYAHLSKLLVDTGDNISVGEAIAISGNTGNSTGPHLHFEIRENDSYYLAVRTRRNPELWFSMEGMGAIYGTIPDAENNTRVDISPDPKPRPPYTTFSYGLTYGFYDKTIGSDDIYKENYAFGDVKPGTYTITALDGAYTRVVTVGAGEVVNADEAVSVENDEQSITEFRLKQNYPNPFNPSTTINYTIPHHAVSIGRQAIVEYKNNERRFGESLYNVTLKIYDILGREVATLVNEQQQPGNYEVIFNAELINEGLPSGIYFYRLVVSGNIKFINTKKMILLE